MKFVGMNGKPPRVFGVRALIGVCLLTACTHAASVSLATAATPPLGCGVASVQGDLFCGVAVSQRAAPLCALPEHAARWTAPIGGRVAARLADGSLLDVHVYPTEAAMMALLEDAPDPDACVMEVGLMSRAWPSTTAPRDAARLYGALRAHMHAPDTVGTMRCGGSSGRQGVTFAVARTTGPITLVRSIDAFRSTDQQEAIERSVSPATLLNEKVVLVAVGSIPRDTTPLRERYVIRVRMIPSDAIPIYSDMPLDSGTTACRFAEKRALEKMLGTTR